MFEPLFKGHTPHWIRKFLKAKEAEKETTILGVVKARLSE